MFVLLFAFHAVAYVLGMAAYTVALVAGSSILGQTETWALLLGLLTPLLTSVVQQPQWTNQVRVVVAVVAAGIVGTLTVIATGTLDTTNWFASFGLVLVAAQTAYQTIWKPSGVAGRIESLTSAGKPPQHRADAP